VTQTKWPPGNPARFTEPVSQQPHRAGPSADQAAGAPDARLQIETIRDNHPIRHRDGSYDAQTAGEVRPQSGAGAGRAIRNPRCLKLTSTAVQSPRRKFATEPQTLADLCPQSLETLPASRFEKLPAVTMLDPVPYLDCMTFNIFNLHRLIASYSDHQLMCQCGRTFIKHYCRVLYTAGGVI